jgi:peptide deformylase
MTAIIKYPNNILNTPTAQFDFNNPFLNPNDLSVELMKVMNDNNTISLSVNQIGIPYSVMVIKGHPENFVFFNPKMVNASTRLVLMEEACLSFPGVTLKIKRPDEVRLRFQMPSGQTTTQTFSGLTARTIQHELDHLNGVLFINRANRYHRDKAMKGYYNE